MLQGNSGFTQSELLALLQAMRQQDPSRSVSSMLKELRQNSVRRRKAVEPLLNKISHSIDEYQGKWYDITE